MINMINHLGFRIYIINNSIFLGKARWENLGEIDLQRMGGWPTKQDDWANAEWMLNNVWYSSSWRKQASNNDEANNALFAVWRSYLT